MSTNAKSSYMRTFTGILFNVARPNPLHIEIEDIAHGLCGEGRYANQSRIAIPVAAHAMAITDILKSIGADVEIQYAALNHDDSEAYTLDFPAPLKHQCSMASFRAIESRLMHAISKRFDFLYPVPAVVKFWDTWCRRVEQGLYMRGHKVPGVINDIHGKPLEASGYSAPHFLVNSLEKYVKRTTKENLKAQFLDRFFDLRCAACFALPADQEEPIKVPVVASAPPLFSHP